MKASVSGNNQKAFIKIFDSICQWNSPWERWNDMVSLFAIELSGLDFAHLEERKKTYESIARKYKPDEMERFADLFSELIQSYEENPFRDFLGQMYMELGLGNSHTGQFFTPYSICQMMSEIEMEGVENRISDHGWISINDPACGGGATLISTAEVLYKKDINYQEHALFIGQDLDQTVALMCFVQLSMIGCPGYIRIGDTICNPPTGDILFGEGTSNTWYTPMWYSWIWQGRIMARRMDKLLSQMPPRKTDDSKSNDVPVKKPKEVRQNDRGLQISIFD